MLSMEQRRPSFDATIASSMNPPHFSHTSPYYSTTNVSLAQPTPPQQQHIWIISGPAGCGKSTVAQHISSTLGLPFIEGDEFHPPANVQRMAQGIALTDADRWDWLIILRQRSLAALAQGAPGVVLTCSALKRKYRDVIRIAAYVDSHVRVHFVYLRANQEVLLARVKGRQGHFMKDDMVRSQLETLEEPTPDETDVLSVDVAGEMSAVNGRALKTVMSALETLVVNTTARDL